MGIHNELKRATDLQRGFRRAAGLVDPGGVERLGETLTPIVNVWERPDCSVLMGELRWMGQIQQAAVAGQYSLVALSPPATGNRLIRVESIALRAATAGNVRIGVDARNAGLGAGGIYAPFDERVTVQTPSAVLYAGTAAAPASPAAYIDYYAGTTMAWVMAPVPFILVSGGRSLNFYYASAVNVLMNVGIVWTERELLPGEGRDEVR